MKALNLSKTVCRAKSLRGEQRDTINTGKHDRETSNGNFSDHGHHAKNKSIATLVTNATMETLIDKVFKNESRPSS
jgi:hypothetical protein